MVGFSRAAPPAFERECILRPLGPGKDDTSQVSWIPACLLSRDGHLTCLSFTRLGRLLQRAAEVEERRLNRDSIILPGIWLLQQGDVDCAQ